MRQRKSFLTQYLIPILILIGLLIAVKNYQACKGGNSVANTEQQSADKPGKTGQASSTNSPKANQKGIPSYALDVLAYIREHDESPPGVVGGRTFSNREKRLPAKDASGQPLKYREWDVKKKVNGQNRGAERLGTDSDGKAYYTKDHYKTFVLIE